ncbi:MAG: hypothetical protein DRJ51_04350 [Thermoprotei archaeon]|nr:MAG: hypothetical protein DRJ51_04350 [Thermoprotei archaeon]RLF01532.1 MAG: hypothetical protein DRJ59_05860 [Thermoprotei archaeon]
MKLNLTIPSSRLHEKVDSEQRKSTCHSSNATISISYADARRKLLLLIIMIELVYVAYMLVLISPVAAWTTIGKKWPSPPYPNLSYANTCDGTEWTATETSLSDWENIDATNPPNFYVYDPDNPNEPHISIWDPYEPDVTWDGRAIIWYSGDWIVFVEIQINEYYTSTYEFDKVRSVAGHEIGHALGLGDESEDKAVLMNPNSARRYDEFGIYKPTQDEVNGINYLYGG